MTDKELIEEIMQTGFEVAMSGDPFRTGKENEIIQKKEYEKAIKKYTKAFQRVREEERAICRQIFIDEVDWGEWYLSTENIPEIVGEIFDEARKDK